jgi:DedD protein
VDLSRLLPNFTDELHFYRMSLFSFLRKNKQESASDDSAFYSRAEEDSKAVRSRAKRRQTKQGGQDEPSNDPVLPEKKRARRRLIGAVALVLAAIVGLPMVLDSEPKPLADDVAIQIPSKDKPGANISGRQAVPDAARIAAAASLDPKEEVIESPQAAAVPVIPRAEVANVMSKGHAEGETKTATPSANVVNPVTEKPVTEKLAAEKTIAEKPGVAKPSNSQLVGKSDSKPDSKTAERTDDARAKALLDGKPDPKATENKSGKFVIQVAALATKEKVNELQTKLTSAGIKSYTQKIATEGGERTRIRVGPFVSKDEAEKTRAKIVKLGLNGTLVPT